MSGRRHRKPKKHKTPAGPKQPEFLKKPLEEMTETEWESLCDGCGLCCLSRSYHPETGKQVRSNIACFMLDLKTVKCTDYPNRLTKNPNCMKITPKNVRAMYWLPKTCGYRLAAEGQPLPEWHHLMCGDGEAVHTRGPSKRGELISELALAKACKIYEDFDPPEDAPHIVPPPGEFRRKFLKDNS